MNKVGLDDYIRHCGRKALDKLLAETKSWGRDLPLHQLNDEVVYVPSRNAVVRFEDGLVMRPRDFVTDIFADRRHLVTAGRDKERQVSTALTWMQWPGRRVAKDMTFLPGAPLFIDGCVNLWKGWAVEPSKGDISMVLELLDHLFAGAQSSSRWFWQWVAYPIQHPGVKLRTAVMMHGLMQGSGKTLMGETIAALYGEAGKKIGQEELEREFNTYMDCAAFVVGDEVTTRGSRREMADRLKNLVTRPTATINKKFQPEYTLANLAQFYLTSNHDDALYLEDSDRRFFVHRVESDALSPEFTRRFADWQANTDWKAALLHHLMHEVDCSDFNPYAAAPMTLGKQDMIRTGLTDLDSWVRQLPYAPVHPDSPIRSIGPLQTPEELRMMAFGKDARCTLESVGLAMRRAGFIRVRNVKVEGRLMTLWPTVKGLEEKQLKMLLAERRAAASGLGKLCKLDGTVASRHFTQRLQ